MAREKQTAPRKKSGKPIADKTTVIARTVHPIDTLVVQQLQNLLDGERALKARYAGLDASSDTTEIRMAFSYELAELKERADRLYRFMNALDYYGSLDYGSLGRGAMFSVAQ